MTKANGANLDADEKVGVVNNFMHSLFKQLSRRISEIKASYAGDGYLQLPSISVYPPKPWSISRSELEQSQLTAALFYEDTAGKMEVSDHTKVVADANHGLNTRYGFSKESGTIEMVRPIFSDVFFSERLLLSFVDLKVILNRKGNEFCLMASENDVDYRVKLIDAYLKIRKVKVNPSISMAHEVALKKVPAMYPIRCVECKSFIIPAGNPSLRKYNVFNGLLPKSFVFGLVESAAFNGAYQKIHTTSNILTCRFNGLSVNGEEVTFKPIQLSFAGNPRYIKAYSRLFSGLGQMYSNSGKGISREEFPKGYAIYAFDLTADMCGSSLHFNAVQRGNFAVDIKLSVAPIATVSLLYYGEFENLIQIDSDRNVIYDYSG